MTLRFRSKLLLVAGLLAVASAPSSAQDKPADRKFTLEMNSKFDVTAAKKTHKLTNATDLQYLWLVDPAAKTRTLILEQTGSRVLFDGAMTQNVVMNRFGLARVDKSGKTLETRVDEADEKVKELLTDSYGPPLCVVTVDDQGAIVKEEVVAKAGAKEQVDRGIVATCTLFHSPYYADKADWERPVNISLGIVGGYAAGTLKYSRVKDFDPAKPRFTVSGTAANVRFDWKDAPMKSSRNVKYEISGEQTYDPALKEWTSGTLNLKVQYQVYAGEAVESDERGTMVFGFKLVAE